MKNYPNYLTFKNRKALPSVLNQAFPLPDPKTKKRYFPQNKILESYLNTAEKQRKFEIAQFFKFLKDTIEVEHFLVIPAIANLKRLNYFIPNQAMEDLYKIATDEAFHAEQSLTYLNRLKQEFQIVLHDEMSPPKFIQNLDNQKLNPIYKPIEDLLPIVFGIVTETRISIELGTFAKNTQLEDSVREICFSHAVDEVIHSSQFQALGIWLWEKLEEKTQKLVSNSFVDAIFYRNLPDLESIIGCLSFACNMDFEEAKIIISQNYNNEMVMTEMMELCKPTLKYLFKHNMVSQQQIDDRMSIEKERFTLGYFHLNQSK